MGKCFCPMITGYWASLINQCLRIRRGDPWEVVPSHKLGLKDENHVGFQRFNIQKNAKYHINFYIDHRLK